LAARSKIPGARDPFGKGALVALDLATVDRIWTELPAGEALDGLARGTLFEGKDGKAAVAALRPMIVGRTIARPLVENLAAKRSLGIPWRWITRIPSLEDEAAADDKLLRLAEAKRLGDLTAEEIMAIGSAAEREMVGASEVPAALGRLGDRASIPKLEALTNPATIAPALHEAWDDLTPLLVAMGLEDEAEIVAAVTKRVGPLLELLRLAADRGLVVLPWSREGWPSFLRERAAARALAGAS
jgi:hypothetical protein